MLNTENQVELYSYLFDALHTETEEPLALVVNRKTRELELIDKKELDPNVEQMTFYQIGVTLPSEGQFFMHYKGEHYQKERDVYYPKEEMMMTVYFNIKQPYRKYARPKMMFDGDAMVNGEFIKRFYPVNLVSVPN